MNAQMLLQTTLMCERFLTQQLNRHSPVWVHKWVFRESFQLKLSYTKYVKIGTPHYEYVADASDHPLRWKMNLEILFQGKDVLHTSHESGCSPLWVACSSSNDPAGQKNCSTRHMKMGVLHYACVDEPSSQMWKVCHTRSHSMEMLACVT